MTFRNLHQRRSDGRQSLGLWRADVATMAGLKDARNVQQLEKAGVIQQFEDVAQAASKVLTAKGKTPRRTKVCQIEEGRTNAEVFAELIGINVM